jgi:formylglycine-generating enzyme required for sulfatase activity
MMERPAEDGADFTPPASFDDFRLVRLLGRGAMGVVWLAHDRLLDRAVAIKFILGVAGDAERARFLVEARAIARLSHPNVVAIYRAGEIARRPYLVSELVRGATLSEVPRPVPGERLLSIALGLARGLAAAHRRGVLHRDLKPANVILAEDGEVKLLDFGVAKLLDVVGEERPRAGERAGEPAGEGDVARTRGAGVRRALRSLGEGTEGEVVGTPLYMAPELWRGEPASRRSDIYSLGMVLYELAAGQPVHGGVPLDELARLRAEDTPPALAAAAPAVEPRLAAIVDRCIARDPAERFASGDDLRDALEALAAAALPARSFPEGNPYRGLQRFEARHRGLFFGRDAEVRVLVERLRAEPLVVVAGDSGVGKSSLCLAGVLPAFEDAGWSVVRIALGPQLGARLAEDPGHLARAAAGGRVVLFVDQLEELCTLASPDDAARVSEALAALAHAASGARVLATVRSDFLTRLAVLPGLGAEIGAALHLARPLAAEGLREAIVGPARAKGVRFESEEMIEALVGTAAHAHGGLPLLQFALAELWEARDEATGVIPAAALARIGGVGGALARHADGVLAGLLPAGRVAARRILERLITAEGTRARRSVAEIAPPDDAPARAALEALVRGRILVAQASSLDEEEARGDGAATGDEDGTCQIAHEALLDGWDTLRGWISQSGERRAAHQRIERAAAEWERLDRAPDGLWTDRRLDEIAALDPAELGPRERGFLEASRRAAARRRRIRRAIALGVPIAAVLAYGGVRMWARLDLERRVDAHVDEARAALGEARARAQNVEALRAQAFARHDGRDRAGGDATWERARVASLDVDEAYGRAARALEDALELDPAGAPPRALRCELIYERALLAERDHQADRMNDLVERLAGCDAERRRWMAPARLTVETEPAGAAVVLERYEQRGAKLVAVPHASLGAGPVAETTQPWGSYALVVSAPGRVTARLPILLRRGEHHAARVELPRPADVPDGFVYVPAGRFLYGSADPEDMRRNFFNTVPLHERASPAYLIARHEVTFAAWIEWLRALPPDERARRMPRLGVKTDSVGASFGLVELPGGRWRFFFRRADHTYEALDGEPIRYLQRDRRAVQDWRRFPVSGVSYEDAIAYAAWLAASGRVPGAHLCDEHEWERAARGADGRRFPNGEHMDPDDANFDETYGRQPLAFGPDEVGSHPASRSPVGADDLAGNVWEWVRSVEQEGQPVDRGGPWYLAQIAARLMNREIGEPGQRDALIGLRICATFGSPDQRGR